MKYFGQNLEFGKILTTKNLLSVIFLYLASIISYFLLKWPNIAIILFSTLTWGANLFYSMINEGKIHTYIPDSLAKINPFGFENKNASLLLKSSILQSLLTIFFGYDSYLHPQLMDNYGNLYVYPLVLIYTLTWIALIYFTWSDSSIQISNSDQNSKENITEKKIPIKIHTNDQKSSIKFIIFACLVIILILVIFLVDFTLIFYSHGQNGLWNIVIDLPFENESQISQINMSGFLYLLLSIPFIFMVNFNVMNYRKIKKTLPILLNNIKPIMQNYTNEEKERVFSSINSFQMKF